MSDHTSLDGEIAIVTGGARGIGKAVVEVFVADGASVVFCDLDPDLGCRLPTPDHPVRDHDRAWVRARIRRSRDETRADLRNLIIGSTSSDTSRFRASSAQKRASKSGCLVVRRRGICCKLALPDLLDAARAERNAMQE